MEKQPKLRQPQSFFQIPPPDYNWMGCRWPAGLYSDCQRIFFRRLCFGLGFWSQTGSKLQWRKGKLSQPFNTMSTGKRIKPLFFAETKNEESNKENQRLEQEMIVMAVPPLSAVVGTTLTLTPTIDHPALRPLKNISLLSSRLSYGFLQLVIPNVISILHIPIFKQSKRVPNFLSGLPLNLLSISLPFLTLSNPLKKLSTLATIIVSPDTYS